MGCIVEEEALPLKGHLGCNPTASMEEDPITDSFVAFNFFTSPWRRAWLKKNTTQILTPTDSGTTTSF